MSPAAHTKIRPVKSTEQLAAEARCRELIKERDRLGTAEFERVQLRRRAERLDRTRARTRAAVDARQKHQPGLDDHSAQLPLQFEESK